jgi:uncharacterized protein (DUF342 family)
MSRFRVVASADGMKAEVEVTPGPAATRADLDQALQQASVTHGLDQETLAGLAERLGDEQFTARTVVARGTPAVPGTDGLLVLCADLQPVAGELHGDGSIDFHERHRLFSAGIGEEVARWHKPVPGTPGRTVRGTDIAVAKPKENRPQLGKGVKAEDDGRILALREGVVQYVAGKGLDVLDLWVHSGDVDLESGNLHARGTLHVKGDIQDEGLAEADGDVLVQGMVLNGMVRAGGNLAVGAGVMGTRSEMHAGGDLSCRHATNAVLQARGTIRVRDEMVHCRVRASAVEMLEGRGCVLGGEVRAGFAIRVRVAGSPAGAFTVLSAADVGDQVAECAAAVRDHDRAVRTGLKMKHEGSRPSLGTADRAQAAKLELLRIKRELLAAARIEVHGTAWPGVQIRFGDVFLALHEPVQGAAFRFDSDTQTIIQETL